MADVLEKQGDHAGAAQAAEEMRRVSPNQAQTLFTLPNTSFDVEQLAEADPRLSMAERQVEKLEYASRAVALLKEGAKAAGDDPEALNELAWFLATCPDSQLRDPARAVKLAKKAVGKRAEGGRVWNTLGVAHYRAGAREEAIDALSRSIELTSGGSPGDWFFLAMADWQKGDKDKARSWYDKAAQWMEKNKSQDDELRRFRAEAATVLGITDDLNSAAKKEKTPAQHSKP